MISFVREFMHTYPSLRYDCGSPITECLSISSDVLKKLMESLDQIRSISVYRSALLIMGEYAESPAELKAALANIKKMTGGARLIKPTVDATEGEKPNDTASQPTSTGPRVLSDGTYASSTSLSEKSSTTGPATSEESSFLRTSLLKGDTYLASVLGTSPHLGPNFEL